MDVSLNATQIEIRRRFGELVNDELIPGIRRMGEAAAPADATSVRNAVWRALVDLGATRLLLPVNHGGEDAGQQGAVMLTELLGTALYQGPLLDTMAAAELLVGSGDGKRVAEIAEGAAVPLAVRESGHDDLTRPGPLETPGGATVVEARRRFVGFVADGRYLLVVGRPAGADPGRACAALVPRDHPTVSYRRHDDTGRGELYATRFTGTPVLSWHGDPARGGAAWPAIVAGARIRHAAYLVGLCQGALDLAVARARDRRQFGREIGRFQALAFRLAELAARVEGVRWLVRAAAWEADEGRDARLGAAQSLATAADLAGDVTVTAMQVHGAYGILDDSDIQIYYRRAHIDRVWMGTPGSLRREALPLLLDAVRAGHPQRR